MKCKVVATYCKKIRCRTGKFLDERVIALHNGAFATPLCRNIAGAVKDEMSIDHLLAILFKFPAKPTRTQYPFSNLQK
jgi:hypothetical protein